MKYNSTIEYLYGLQKYGMKYGLDNITRLMSSLGNPQRSFCSIHVAGTNGKGSTSAMIESILRTSGINTGLFTSPHVVSFTERIRINGTEIDENHVIELADEVRNIAEGTEDFYPTFFEVVTAMAFLYFRKMKVDWAVVEVGMGGRLDATNIILPEASVITSIGMDHSEFLGHTLKEIAGEKAGIIKDDLPVITAEQTPEIMEVLEQRTTETNSALFKYKSDFHKNHPHPNPPPSRGRELEENPLTSRGSKIGRRDSLSLSPSLGGRGLGGGGAEFSSELTSEDPDGICFNYYGHREYNDIKLPLSGEHQMINASIAAKTTEIISDRHPDMACDIRKGIENVKLPGRLEMIKDNPQILIDGAHNPSAANVLSRYLRKILGSRYRRIILVIGIMSDKDIEGILQPLLPLSSEIIFTSPAYGRAASPDLLAACAGSMGYYSRKALSVTDALNLAEGLYIPGDIIVVAGSFYTIGEAKEALVHKGVLAMLRE